MKSVKICLAFAFLASSGFSEKSSIAFYDSLGVDKTAEFGWTGGKANGHFFIKQFQDGSGMKLEDGNLTVDGTITASHLYGDIDAGAIQGTISADKLDSIPWGKISGRPATINLSKNSVADSNISSVHWNKLQGVPAGFSDTIDNGISSISAGTGITITNPNGPAVTIGVTPNTYAAKTHYHSGSDIGTDFSGRGIKADTVRLGNYFRLVSTKVGGNGGNNVLYFVSPFINSSSQDTFALGIESGSGNNLVHCYNDFKCWGTLVYTSLQQSSDIRLKTNISPLTNAIDKVKLIQGVYFDWKEPSARTGLRFPASRTVGVLAQDVEKAVPELVSTDRDGYKTVAYDKLAVLLIEAVKEQDTIIRRQEQLITELKGRIERIEQSLAPQ